MRGLFKAFLHLPHLFLLTILSFFSLTISSAVASEDALTRTCGQIPIQQPFSNNIQTSNQYSTPLNHMLFCKSQKLYFRTSLGLFPISSINYTTKLLTISHPYSCSKSINFVSPILLSAGFPTPPRPNSLLLFDCSNSKNKISPVLRNYTCSQACGDTSNCLLVDNIEKLDKGFHPIDLNCSHYIRVYRKYSSNDDDDDDDEFKGFELGTRISFDIPDHVPNVCNECEKPNGNCGVGLRCICHAKECSKSPLN